MGIFRPPLDRYGSNGGFDLWQGGGLEAAFPHRAQRLFLWTRLFHCGLPGFTTLSIAMRLLGLSFGVLLVTLRTMAL